MNKRISEKILEYLILNLFVLVGIVFILELWKTNILIYPLEMRSDVGIALYGWKQNYEGSVFGYSTSTSYPYYAFMSDFPTVGLLGRIVNALIVHLFRGNIVAAVNFVYLAGYFLAAATAYWVLSKMEIRREIAFVSSILYTFLPFHFLRGIQHLGFTTYWPIPIFLYFCILSVKGEQIYYKSDKGLVNIQNIIHVVTLVFIGGKTIYNTYFACFFLCVVLLIHFIRKNSLICIKQTIFDLGIILITFSFTIIDYIIKIYRYGSNSNVANRSMAEVENYGLKISQLLMPIANHRISILSKLKNTYDMLPLTNENSWVSLGILFAIGFVALLIELVRKTHNEDILACSILNLAALILATIGGGSSIIAIFFTKIRCYNRISIYIAFLAAVSFSIILNALLEKTIKNRIVYSSIIALVLAIGILDQTTPAYVHNYEEIKARWDSDEGFVSEIESIDGAGAKIYQMPYMTYPEGGGG